MSKPHTLLLFPIPKTMKNIKNRIAAGFIALTASFSLAQTANASQGQEMVTFGDSITANGGAPGSRASTSPYKPYIQFHPCFNDKRNWAHQTADNFHYTLADYSCNGTSYSVDAYVNDAIRTGNIGLNTKEVVFMYGGLQPDTHIDALANSTLPNIPKGSNYRALLGLEFGKIRRVAPKARITMVNYLPMTVNDTLCAINDGIRVVPISFPGATNAEAEFNTENGSAAQALGANFINLYDQAKTHDTCQPDATQRWTVALKTQAAPSVMPMHPTDIGHDGMARIITSELQKR